MEKYLHKDDTFLSEMDFTRLEKLSRAVPLLLDALGLEQKEHYNVGACMYCHTNKRGEPVRQISAELPDEHGLLKVRIFAIVEYDTPDLEDACYIRTKKATIKIAHK